MAGVVLETLSWKKLITLGVSMLILLLAFFLIGGLVSPNPSNVVQVIGTKCVNKLGRSTKEWFIPRGNGNEACRSVESLDDESIFQQGVSANQIVFAFWFPHIRSGKQLEFSPWQQNLLTVIQMDIKYDENVHVAEDAVIQLDARIGYRNKEDDVNAWKEYASSLEERKLTCTIAEEHKEEGYHYDCELLPFFELGSLHYDYYLVNIRIPVEPYKGVNMDIGKIEDIHVVGIHQNGGFTKVWVSIKTVMFPLVFVVLIWYWRRIRLMVRPPNLLERTLFALGIAMVVLNGESSIHAEEFKTLSCSLLRYIFMDFQFFLRIYCFIVPLEWLSLAIEMPFMLIVTDIRQGAFYAMLMSFWIIFTGEHIMDQTERNRLVLYWKHLLAIVIGCFCLLLFEICERGVQLSNPFFSIWVTDVGTKLALAFIIIAGIAAACYFFFLCYMIFLVFRNISSKRTSLSSMSTGRRQYISGLIYRFKFLMLATLFCAALTVVFFILSQLSEGRWKWGDEDLPIHFASAFFTGVYGMWNVYVIGLLSLYAPSHKQFAPQVTTEDSQEEVQLTGLPSSTEGSTFQTFAAKAATD